MIGISDALNQRRAKITRQPSTAVDRICLIDKSPRKELSIPDFSYTITIEIRWIFVVTEGNIRKMPMVYIFIYLLKCLNHCSIIVWTQLWSVPYGYISVMCRNDSWFIMLTKILWLVRYSPLGLVKQEHRTWYKHRLISEVTSLSTYLHTYICRQVAHADIYLVSSSLSTLTKAAAV